MGPAPSPSGLRWSRRCCRRCPLSGEPESPCRTPGPRPRGAGMHCSCCGSSSWRPNGWRFPAASWTISAGTAALSLPPSSPPRFLSHWLTTEASAFPPPPPSLSSLSGPAAARFPCSTLLSRTILPLSLRRSLRVSRGPSVLLRGAPEFPHFLSSPTLVFLQVMPLRQSQGLERFFFFFRLPPPPPIVFFFFSASDFFIDRFPPPPSVSGLSSVPDPRVLSLSSPTPPDLSREAFSNLTFRRCVLTRPWHFLNCYKELLSCSFPNLSLEGGWGIDSCSFFPLFFNFPYRKFSTAGL